VTRRHRLLHGLPVPVFAAAGAGAWGAVQELRGHPGVRLVPTPRRAAVLLIAGAVDAEHLPALRRVHDQVPHPRTAVAWDAGAGATTVPVAARIAGDTAEVVRALRDGFTALADDPSTSTADLLADRDPNDWRGVGPFGQGGEGMMGGTPYGRPMAMTGDDRDGLALDRLRLTLGPFLDAFPAALVLDVVLQGEVLQSVDVVTPSVAADSTSPGDGPAGAGSPAARRGLRWLSHALHVHGLDALAARAAILAAAVGAGADQAVLSGGMRVLHRRIRRSGVLATLRGVGHVDSASPLGDDHVRGDARDRWVRRIAAIDDTLRERGQHRALAGLPRAAHQHLPPLLRGATWNAAVATIVSLDLDATRWRPAGVA